jgi:hypothetical protein
MGMKLTDAREAALARRSLSSENLWTEHTKALADLKVGDAVLIQNQTGNHPPEVGQMWHSGPDNWQRPIHDSGGWFEEDNEEEPQVPVPVQTLLLNRPQQTGA